MICDREQKELIPGIELFCTCLVCSDKAGTTGTHNHCRYTAVMFTVDVKAPPMQIRMVTVEPGHGSRRGAGAVESQGPAGCWPCVMKAWARPRHQDGLMFQHTPTDAHSEDIWCVHTLTHAQTHTHTHTHTHKARTHTHARKRATAKEMELSSIII